MGRKGKGGGKRESVHRSVKSVSVCVSPSVVLSFSLCSFSLSCLSSISLLSMSPSLSVSLSLSLFPFSTLFLSSISFLIYFCLFNIIFLICSFYTYFVYYSSPLFSSHIYHFFFPYIIVNSSLSYGLFSPFIFIPHS